MKPLVLQEFPISPHLSEGAVQFCTGPSIIHLRNGDVRGLRVELAAIPILVQDGAFRLEPMQQHIQ